MPHSLNRNKYNPNSKFRQGSVTHSEWFYQSTCTITITSYPDCVCCLMFKKKVFIQISLSELNSVVASSCLHLRTEKDAFSPSLSSVQNPQTHLRWDSPLTIPNKILLYKILLRSMITHAAPVWSSTSLTNYRHLQIYQSKCLRVIGDFPRRTPISNLHTYLQMIPSRQFIYNLTDKFFVSYPAHPNPLIRKTGNYTLQDLHRQYPKCRHKRIKHILL
jgi:hypothetical protein